MMAGQMFPLHVVVLFSVLIYAVAHPCRPIIYPPLRSVTVDCSILHLSHIPKDLPTDTNTLLLSNNNIPAIKPRAPVNISDLTHLHISVNSITKFDNDSLLGGGNVEVLILNDNPLYLSHESLRHKPSSN